MDRKKYFAFISILTLLLFTACSNTNAATATNISISPTEVAATAESTDILLTPTISSTAVSTTLCDHPYYPVRAGATWKYQSTGEPADDYRFTDTITAVREDGFTLTTAYENSSRNQTWACSSDGLTALQLGGPVVAALQSQGIQLDLKLKDVSGVTFPRNITAGDTWQQSLEFESDVKIAGEEGTGLGTAQMNFSAIGMENVSVPAGDFAAMKIQVDTLVDLQVTYEGLTVPVTYTAIYNFWFAPDVGWVKANGNANLAELSFTENIELQSYNIP
jgi:hypothetical protein